MTKYIVIGAGILGASTAYHLAKYGANVTIVDRKDKGQATDAAAGMICPWLTKRRNKAWYFLAKNGAAYYPQLIQELHDAGETNTGYRKVGAISIHTDLEKLQKMEERAMTRREDAPEIGEIRLLSEEETSKLFPPLSKGHSSVYISGAARVNGRALRDALISAAVKLGATFVKGSGEIKHDGSVITGVKADGESYPGEQVIVTAGAWADQLLKPLGIELKLTYQKGQIIHLKMENTVTEEWPVVIPPNNKDILPFDDGKVVIGATHEDDTGFDMRLTAGGLHDIFDKALTFAPGLSDAEFVEARVGFRPYTPNFLPVAGEVPGYQGLFLANGLGASGLTIAPYLGDQIAKAVMGKEIDIDLNNYNVADAIHTSYSQ